MIHDKCFENTTRWPWGDFCVASKNLAGIVVPSQKKDLIVITSEDATFEKLAKQNRDNTSKKNKKKTPKATEWTFPVYSVV